MKQVKYRIAQQPMEVNEAADFLAIGMVMMVVQRMMVADRRFIEPEIKKFLKLRKKFHGSFTEAASTVATALEEGTLDGPEQAVKPLNRLSKSTPQQFTQATLAAAKALRGLWKTQYVRPGMNRLFRMIKEFFEDDDIHSYEMEELIGMSIRILPLPNPIKTLFRKFKRLPQGVSESSLKMDFADPGAWFDMNPDEKEGLKQEFLRVDQELIKSIEIEDPDERLREIRRLYEEQSGVVAKAGVPPSMIKQGDVEPLDKVIRREKNINPDGPTAYILDRVIKAVQEAKQYDQEQWGGKRRGVYRKAITLLQRAKTFDTMERILQMLIDSKLLGSDYLDSFRKDISKVQKNKAVASGKPLVPIHFTPMEPEEFQDKFDSGPIRFAEGYTEEQKREVLGRVGRSVADLEAIFGKGFCGKGPEKLGFKFEGGSGTSTGALASYFAWGGRNNRWEPVVTFGSDFDGLLAHELSHYIEEIIKYRFHEVTDDLYFESGSRKYKRSPDTIFGATGMKLDYFVETWDKDNAKGIFKAIPELGELMVTIQSTPDYARWKDKLGSALELTIPGAIKEVTGIADWEHPEYKNWVETKRYQSDFDPEIIEVAKRKYKSMMGGDGRKLQYYESVVEVWARMTEQYVYTRLAESGIANPWLTQVTYDPEIVDQFMDQDRFEKEIVPIYDKIFKQLKERQILAKVLRSYFSQKVAARPIKIDRGEVERLMDRLFKKFRKKAEAHPYFWKPMGNQRKAIVTDSITLPSVMGEDRKITVAMISAKGNGGPFIAGGFGRHKRTGDPVVIIEANGNYTWKGMATMSNDSLRSILLHELTHAVDKFKKTLAPIQGRIPNSSEIDLKAYYNEPQEVRAYMREIYEDMRTIVHKIMGVPSLRDDWGLGGTVTRRLRDNESWKHMEPYLTRKNRNRIIKGLITAFEDDGLS